MKFFRFVHFLGNVSENAGLKGGVQFQSLLLFLSSTMKKLQIVVRKFLCIFWDVISDVSLSLNLTLNMVAEK